MQAIKKIMNILNVHDLAHTHTHYLGKEMSSHKPTVILQAIK